ncbi:MAG: YraN family protein [Epsilonproteobacteria bacterium]|nr:YraN family protein [Campylobacterota bacterium]
MTNNTQALAKQKTGRAGEQAVSTHLEANGFQVIARNYQTRAGEIDIIAQKDDVVAFIEVKTRFNEYFHITQTITKSKQNKIIKTAKHFAMKQSVVDKVLRFDVAIVTRQNGTWHVNYLPNAFQAG